ncbi:hypothetical protein [Aminobacterium mobile]|jgi:hypothetical protein|uniref:hypothetical protein n=1 Tax=Aminobacterium mobile TaxID=81467 RepID=UPI000467E355|nr:hypothetical protein [Aminobacterium mobile]
MVVNPLHLQLSHWNVEQNAQNVREQNSPASLAGQQGEIVASSLQKEQTVQGGEESARGQKADLKKKNDRGKKKRERENGLHARREEKKEKCAEGKDGFDLYA